jgi:hypothetical protein
LECLIEHFTKILSGSCLNQEILIANTLLHVGQYKDVSYLEFLHRYRGGMFL